MISPDSSPPGENGNSGLNWYLPATIASTGSVRRVSPGIAWQLQADGWRLCAPDGTGLDLGRAERAFLQPLFASPGQPVGREALIANLTDSPWDFDPHRLEVLAHRLRNRVRAATGFALPLRAPRGLGYLLQPELAPVAALVRKREKE